MTGSNWSVPETEVVQRIRERLDADGTDVLATVVDIEGNAYRRPEAKMLLDEGGEGVGSITAGCLEDELVGVADEVRDAGEPRLVTYDLMEGEEEVWGLGVGCNGVIEILLEPLTETYRPAVEAFTDDDLAPLYTPTGLDLGGGSPYQIAHSIVAEVLAVANDRTPRHLQARAGPIHDRVDVDTEAGVSPR